MGVDNGEKGFISAAPILGRKGFALALITFAAALAVSGVAAAPASADAFFEGASSDGTRVFFETTEALDPVADTDGGERDVYQRLGGVTTLISGDADGAFDAEFGGSSDDGTRVFFDTEEPLDPAADTDGGAQDVYQRLGGVTTLISGDADGAFEASFQGASSDGTRVFFQTFEDLDTVADTDPDGVSQGRDVYQRLGGATTLISGDADGIFDAGFEGASSDGARVFFRTEEALVTATDTDGSASDVYQRFAGTTSLISDDADATLPDADDAFDTSFEDALSDGSVVYFETEEPLTPATDTDAQRDVYLRLIGPSTTTLVSGDSDGAFDASFEGVASDGLPVFFRTGESIAAGDTDGGETDVFERQGGVTTLVSGDADGAFGAFFEGASSDGNRVFFRTDEPLVPADDTDPVGGCFAGCDDVYQRFAGATTLISGDGDGAFDASFEGASSDGARVFFETSETLDPIADTDGGCPSGNCRDIYQRLVGITTLISGDGDGAFGADFQGATSDGTRVFFETDESLDPAADCDSGERDIYERSGVGTILISIGNIDTCAPPLAPPSNRAAVPAAAPTGPTGKRAAALKKCKKKKGAARKKCRKRALKLPV